MKVKIKNNNPERSIFLKKWSFRAPPKRRTLDGIVYLLIFVLTLHFLLIDIDWSLSFFSSDTGMMFLIIFILTFFMSIFFLIDIGKRIKREELILSIIKDSESIIIYNQNMTKDIYLLNNVEVVLLQEQTQNNRRQLYKIVLRYNEEEIVLGFWKSNTSEWILNLTKTISENLEIPYNIEGFTMEDLDLPTEIL